MKIITPVTILSFLFVSITNGSVLDSIGVTSLLSSNPELTGAGVTAAQVEASSGGAFHTDPSINLSTTFKYFASPTPFPGGTSYNPSLYSAHATDVARNFLGTTGGVAPGILSLDVYDADYFFNGITLASPDINAQIINQSFIFNPGDMTPGVVALINRRYDNFANNHGTLFISATNNDSSPGRVSVPTSSPATMYNGISVGVASTFHSGEVHIVTPASTTSESAPYVAGAAALLIHAANLGQTHAQVGTNAADSRIIKAAIIAGGDKSTLSGWTQTSSDPLDARYGSGMLNVARSHQSLIGGEQNNSQTSLQALNTVNTSFDPTGLTAVTSKTGWDLNTITATTTQDATAHYYFDLSAPGLTYDLSAALTWNSITALGGNFINNFDFVLLDISTDTIVTQSLSLDENVEYLYFNNLAAGYYDLQVILRGNGLVLSDTYAMSYMFDSRFVSAPEPGTAIMILVGILECLVFNRSLSRKSRC